MHAITTVYSRGTPAYRAPELLMGKYAFSNKVDVWYIGCILYELVVGQRPLLNPYGVISSGLLLFK